MITGAQVRAAKAMLGWSGNVLAEKAGIAISTIRRIEAEDQVLPSASVKILLAIKSALEKGGIEFIGTPEDSPGVRLKKLKD